MTKDIALKHKKKELLLNGDMDGLLKLAEQAVKARPNSLDARRSLATQLFAKPERGYEGLIIIATLVSESASHEISDLFLLGSYFIELGYPDLAVDFLHLGANTTSSLYYEEYINSVNLALCMSYLYTEQYDKAADVANKLPADVVYFSDEGPWTVDGIKTTISQNRGQDLIVEGDFQTPRRINQFLSWFNDVQQSFSLVPSNKEVVNVLDSALKKVHPKLNFEIEKATMTNSHIILLKVLPDTVATACALVAKSNHIKDWIFKIHLIGGAVSIDS